MSVLVMDPQCFEYIRSGLTLAAYRNTCDAYFSSTIRRHFQNRDVEEESSRLVRSWAALNELSFCVAYNVKGHSMFEFIGPRKYQITPVQLLKYVQCALYNIELETIESKESYSQGALKNVPEVTQRMKEDHELLKDWCEDIKNAIIDNLVEYDLALWSDPPGTIKKIENYRQKQIAEGHTIKVLRLMEPL